MSTKLEVSHEGGLERAAKRLDPSIRVGLVTAGNKLALRAVALQESERPGTIATGQTIRSHTVSRVFRDSQGNLFVEVGPRTNYARWGIGTGRAPGKRPPLKRIVQWVREKPGGSSLPEREVYAIAQAVARTISIHGTTKYEILERALDMEHDAILRILRLSVRIALTQ